VSVKIEDIKGRLVEEVKKMERMRKDNREKKCDRKQCWYHSNSTNLIYSKHYILKTR